MPLLAQLCGETGGHARRFRALVRYRDGFFTFCVNGGGCICCFLSSIHALFEKGQCVGFHGCRIRHFLCRNYNWLCRNYNWLCRNYNWLWRNYNWLWRNYNWLWRNYSRCRFRRCFHYRHRLRRGNRLLNFLVQFGHGFFRSLLVQG